MQDLPERAKLRENIRERGVILPVFFFGDEVIDGAKRMACADETAQKWKRVDLETEEEAARVLWGFHPERALRRFGGELPLLKQADLFGARPSEVVEVRKRLEAPPKKKKQTPEYRRRITQIRLEGDAASLIGRLRNECRSNFSEIIEAALEVANREKLERRISEKRERRTTRKNRIHNDEPKKRRARRARDFR